MKPVSPRSLFPLLCAILVSSWLTGPLPVPPVSALADPAIPGSRTFASGKVLWIYDGDTLEVAGTGKVRLLGIDAPERDHSRRDDYFKDLGITPAALRRMHREGREFLEDQVAGQTVTLTTDAVERDRYGRLLAYVILPDGRLLNRVLIENGYALVYRRFEFTLKTDFLRAEDRARRQRRGLWQ